MDALNDVNIGRVQRLNLDFLETELRKQWSLGKNILLCWSPHQQGVEVLVVPNYYLGNFSASLNDCSPVDRLDALNGRYIRQMIAGSRKLTAAELLSTASRFELQPQLLRLPVPLANRPELDEAVDALLRRYSINYVKRRAVLLFDIVDFSLLTPFEQTSQLNSLSYSLNSAYSKLLGKNIEVNFSRTTTGDGYYVWNQDLGPQADVDLFYFMLLVVADNAIARGRARRDTVPLIRTGFHVGGHFEFYQTEGVKPSMNSYIVGDVTIELARMLDLAQPGQIFVGEIQTQMPTSKREDAYLLTVDSQSFVERISRRSQPLMGIELSGEEIAEIYCYLTGENGACAGQSPRRFRITDKHSQSRNVYNLRINIRSRSGRPIALGLADNALPKRRSTDRQSRVGGRRAEDMTASAKVRPTISALEN